MKVPDFLKTALAGLKASLRQAEKKANGKDQELQKAMKHVEKQVDDLEKILEQRFVSFNDPSHVFGSAKKLYDPVDAGGEEFTPRASNKPKRHNSFGSDSTASTGSDKSNKPKKKF